MGGLKGMWGGGIIPLATKKKQNKTKIAPDHETQEKKKENKLLVMFSAGQNKKML